MPQHARRLTVGGLTAGFLLASAVIGGCSSNPLDLAPPTIEPARPAASPPTGTAPAGKVLPMTGRPRASITDGSTRSLVVLVAGPDTGSPAALVLVDGSDSSRTVTLPGPATAVTGDGRGTVYAATRGGIFTVDLAGDRVERTPISGAEGTDFTAIARRADGRFVLGSADGVAYTLTADFTVAEKADIFARVDAIATQGDYALVLDRAQTSVTALNPDGSAGLALRAGLGATTMTADSAGRILVTDTRGGQLLVFGVDPLIERQAYPVGGSPYGVAGSGSLVWVSQTANNTVVGYDLATGIPVEKVRYPTVRQPDSLAFDDASGTLYVVSGSGSGVQVIPDAAGPR